MNKTKRANFWLLELLGFIALGILYFGLIISAIIKSL